MDDNEIRRKVLVQEIEKAFIGVHYPGNERLVIDECSDCREIAEAFSGKHWKDVSPEIIDEHYDAFAFFSDAAFQFFLPAFMSFTVQQRKDSPSIAVDTTVFILTSPHPQNPRFGRFRQRIETLTHEQKRAARHFLQFMRERGYEVEVDSAMHNYWEGSGA